MRLAAARLRFCSNSFSPRRTRLADMQAHEWTTGSAALAGIRADGGELDGLRSFLALRPGWELTMLRCASAPPGGPLSAELFGQWMIDVEDGLRRGRFDAVYLSLHGACQAEGDPAADITILRRVRSMVGRTPVVASFDMRANLSEEVAILLDGASAARVWPEGGGFEATVRALTMLEGLMSGRCRPVGALARVPMVLSEALLPEALGELWRDGVTDLRAPVLDASVFAGFAWGDSPSAGPSAMVWADRDSGAARNLAAHLALALARWRGQPVPALPTPPEAIAALPPHTVSASGEAPDTRPALLLDLADDPQAGGAMQTPGLLRAMLDNQSRGDRRRVLLAAMVDAGAAAIAAVLGAGGAFRGVLGGSAPNETAPIFGDGVAVEATILTAPPDGGFAVLRCGAVDVLVTARRPTIVSPAWLESLGLVPGGYDLLAVKGGAHAKAAFATRVRCAVECDATGPSSPDLLRLPYHAVPAIRRTMPRLAEGETPRPLPAWTARAAAAPPSDQTRADQPDGGDKQRGAYAQQQRPQPLGAQGG